MKNLVNSIESANNYLETSENANMLVIYSNNSTDLWLVIERLTNCVSKNMRRGIAVSVEHLANCATLQNLMRTAARKLSELEEGRRFSIDDRRAAAYRIAENIITDAKYLACE